MAAIQLGPGLELGHSRFLTELFDTLHDTFLDEQWIL